MFFQPPRVKTKPISIIHYQQNISVTGIYFTGRFTQAYFSRDQPASVSAQTKADRGYIGSPSLVKSPLTQHLSRPPNCTQCFVLLPQLLELVTLLQALRQTPAVRHVHAGCIFSSSAPSSILVLHCVPEEVGGFVSSGGFTNTYPRCEGGSTRLSAVASNSWQNACWGSSPTPSGELEFFPAISSC